MKWPIYIALFSLITISCAVYNSSESLEGDTNTREIAIDLTTRLKSFAGLTVSGMQGRAKITVRGVNSIMNQDPLFILDNRPVPSYADLYSLVNTAPIVKIEVLKNPVDLSYYGFRGANGVIVVTTNPS